ELGVKTSLYLVFSAFLFNAAFQVSSFVKPIESRWAFRAIVFAVVGAALALSGGIFLLVAAMVRRYSVIPLEELTSFLTESSEYRSKYPNAEVLDEQDGILTTVNRTVQANFDANEKKAGWIEIGAMILFAAIPFVVIAGVLALTAYVSNRPS